jgi:hypothetical protein
MRQYSPLEIIRVGPGPGMFSAGATCSTVSLNHASSSREPGIVPLGTHRSLLRWNSAADKALPNHRGWNGGGSGWRISPGACSTDDVGMKIKRADGRRLFV